MVRRLGIILPLVLSAGVALVFLRTMGPTARNPAPLPPSYLAFIVPQYQEVAFAISPNDRDLRLTLSFQATGGTRVRAREEMAAKEDASARFCAEIAISGDDTKQPLWRGSAVLEVGTVGAAIADTGLLLTEERVIVLPDIVGATRIAVEVRSLDRDPLLKIAVRLAARGPRSSSWPSGPPSADSRTQEAGDNTSVFGWPYLEDSDLAVLHAEPTRMRASLEPHLLARITRLATTEVVFAVPLPGEVITAGHAAAWTGRGPGTLRLVLSSIGPEPLEITVRTVDNVGATTEMRVNSDEVATELDFGVKQDGALTVIAEDVVSGAIRARVFALAGALQLGVGQQGELSPDRRRLTMWRLDPLFTSLRATLVDGIARVQVWPAFGDPLPTRLAYRVTDLAGDLIANGEEILSRVATGFETYAGSNRSAYEPLAFVVQAPPGATLELGSTAGLIDVALEARVGPNPAVAAPAYAVPLRDARLRFAPYQSRRWMSFYPDNHRALEGSSRKIELLAQVRLEATGTRSVPPAPMRAIEPLPPRARQTLIEKIDRKEWQEHVLTGFATNTDVHLEIDRHVAPHLILDYLLTRDALGQSLRIVVDGEPVLERAIMFPRGRFRIRELSPGSHQVRIDGPRGLILSPARGDAGNYAERQVWHRDGALRVPLHLGADEEKTLNMVVYTDQPRKVRIRAQVLAKGQVFAKAGAVTLRDQTLEATSAPIESRWLDLASGPGAAARFHVHLARDLGQGTHVVKVTLLDRQRDFVRFFEAGLQRPRTTQSFAVEWEDP